VVRAFVGRWRSFAIVHMALIASAAVSPDRNLPLPPLRLVYGLFILAGVGGVIWAGLLARQENESGG